MLRTTIQAFSQGMKRKDTTAEECPLRRSRNDKEFVPDYLETDVVGPLTDVLAWLIILAFVVGAFEVSPLRSCLPERP